MENQRICIKFCVKNGFKGAEIFWMLKTAYGDAVMSRRRVFEWYKRFKEGREETADNERSGRPSTSTTPEKVDKVLEVAEEAGISFGYEKTQRRSQRPERNGQSQSRSDNRRPRIAEEDETWIYGFDSETTQQASEWRFKNEPRPKKVRKAPSKVKVMLTVRLREAIRQKRPELWRSKSWILHHDNAPSHTTLKISKFLQDTQPLCSPNPPYSPDLAPCDFFLFGKLKKVKGSKISEHRRDQSGIEEGHEGDPENRLPEVFCRLQKKRLKCIAANGDYFQGDNLNLTDVAVLLDAVSLFSISLRDLMLSFSHLHLPLRWPSSSCSRTSSGARSSQDFVSRLVDTMKQTEIRGITGRIQLDNLGRRSNFTLDLLDLKPSKFQKMFSRFKNGMESVKDEKRVGRSILHRNPEKVSQIDKIKSTNREETGISKSLFGSIIKEDLQLRKTPSKFVPKMLTIQQKEIRVEVAKKCLKWWKKTLIRRKK
ncbi:hypothetical protein LAZ67_18002535 [Cordylochernes scorpioides]|uniref:Mos1 transposase HTH domain-containing protein n=1 Tax=Cordylochernes scorpioides TaxID=51811 RepID=A0ABY6LJ80_9ARAC|nr:hypothetical protein LAZ67_18002535 [Cordylochernes scorpioides]